MMRSIIVCTIVLGCSVANAQSTYQWPRPFRSAPFPATQPQPVSAKPIVIAQADPPEKNVPPVALWEVQRRGNMVQLLGDVRSADVDAIADALAIPPDDSYKWFICVVTTANCRYCEKLKYDFIHASELQAWVNVDDPAKSTCHYQVRRIEDTTQRDWYAGIGEQLKRGGFPALVIQPPKNGKYGPNKTVVTVLHGYDGNAKKLSDKMTAAITRYVTALQRKKQPSSLSAIEGGCEQSNATEGFEQEPISGPPPFLVPAKPVDPVQPVGPPQDWPAPPILTLDQIKLAAPGAPAEFLLEQLAAKPTDSATVTLAWQAYQAKHVPNSPAVEPIDSTVPSLVPIGFWTALITLFVGGLSGGATVNLILRTAVWILGSYRNYRIVNGQSPRLNQADFDALIDALKKQQSPNPAS